MKRTQIYLDEEQDARLAKRAAARGVTKSELIREAIDAFFDGRPSRDLEMRRYRAAIDAAAGIAPYLPPGKEYVEKLREADRRRQEELDRHWRR